MERIRFAAQAMRSLSVDQPDFSEKVASLRTEVELIARYGVWLRDSSWCLKRCRARHNRYTLPALQLALSNHDALFLSIKEHDFVALQDVRVPYIII